MINFLSNRNPFDCDIQYPKKGGGYRIIKSGNWWINQHTPVGEPAELWERKPYGGKKLLDIDKYTKASCEPNSTI